MNRRKYKPVIDLRPIQACIQTGTILFLRRDLEALDIGRDLGLEPGLLGHPCVVVGPPGESGLVKILVITTLGGASIKAYIAQPFWGDFLQIAPTADHPLTPEVQLRVTGAPNNLRGYVDIANQYQVPLELLTKWIPNIPVNQVHFDTTSMNIVLRSMKRATDDQAVGAAGGPARSAQNVPFAARLARPRSGDNMVQGPTTTIQTVRIPRSKAPYSILVMDGLVARTAAFKTQDKHRTSAERAVLDALKAQKLLNRILLCVTIAIAAVLIIPAFGIYRS